MDAIEIAAPRAYASAARSRARILGNVALTTAAALLACGFFAPLLTVKQFWIFSDTVTLASMLGTLLHEGELALFVLLGGFGVLFPVAKLSCLAYVWNLGARGSARAHRAFRLLDVVGKWSMLDVFVVAVVVVAVKMPIVSAEPRIGVFLFGGSVLLTMVLSRTIARSMSRWTPTEPGN